MEINGKHLTIMNLPIRNLLPVGSSLSNGTNWKGCLTKPSALTAAFLTDVDP